MIYLTSPPWSSDLSDRLFSRRKGVQIDKRLPLGDHPFETLAIIQLSFSSVAKDARHRSTRADF